MAGKLGFLWQCGEFAPAGHEVMQEGMPTKRFKKDLIKVGVYKHPTAGWTLDVTTDRMDRWIAAFKRMQASAIRVPIPAGHSYDPRDGQGFLVGLERVGDTLWGIIEMVGEEAIKLAYKTQAVSVSINPEFIDGKGTSYGEIIEHVALTGYPVVPGQEEFKAIAASLYQLSDKVEGDQPMTKEQLDKFRKLLGAGEDMDEAKLLSRIEERFAAHATEKSALDVKVTALSGEVETLKAKIAASTKDVKTVDPEVLDERAESAEEKIDGLVPKGRITPAVAAALKDVLVGKAGTRNAFCLSRTVSGTPESIVNAVVKALDQNDPVKLGEQTKAQSKTFSLNREVPGSEVSDKADPEIVGQMGGSVPKS
jgi:hypothetical protein